jgi:hypothetical protein
MRNMTLCILALLIAGGVAKAGAEEVTGEILFEPNEIWRGYNFQLDTDDDGIADKYMEIGHAAYEGVIKNLLNYLVPGAKIVYENKGMKNIDMEGISQERFIGIVTIKGIYVELAKLLSPYERLYMPTYLYEKIVREGRKKEYDLK